MPTKSSTRRQKRWKRPKDKPSRPLSAYNLFFRSERSNMLGVDAPSEELENLKKRVHCKTHGKIGFAEMARAIGAKWKSLEPEKRKTFEGRAQQEKDRYTQELASWKAARQNEKAGASSPEEKKGLDVMATAAIASEPMETPPVVKSSQVQIITSDSLRRTDADTVCGTSTSFLHQRRRLIQLELMRALQDRQLGCFPRLNTPFVNYPSAAEASATALLQYFQGGSELGLPLRTQLYDVDSLSQLAASRFPSYYGRPTMQGLNYMANIRFNDRR